MIEITYTLTNDFVDIELSGHAGYAENGYDIVCAAVSSHLLTLMQALITAEENGECAIDSDSISDGYAKIVCELFTESIYAVCNAITQGIELLCDNYPQNIKVTVKNG